MGEGLRFLGWWELLFLEVEVELAAGVVVRCDGAGGGSLQLPDAGRRLSNWFGA